MRILQILLATVIMSFALASCGKAETRNDKDSVVADSSSELQSGEIRLAAVLVYADWCASCQVLDPKVASVRENDIAATRFVTLDYTDRNDNAFYAAAEAAGVGPAIKTALGEKIKTGQLLLVDIDDQTIAGTIKKDSSEEQMLLQIRKAASEA